MVKEIKLNGKYGEGKVTLVDDEDYERLNQYEWHVNQGYAARNEYCPDVMARRITKMHNEVMNAKFIDHINHNKLDNRKENLRLCTNQENQFNRQKINALTSKYKGVSWCKNEERWRVNIKLNQKQINCGLHNDEKYAAMIYDYYAIKYFSDRSCLNFPEHDYTCFHPYKLDVKPNNRRCTSKYRGVRKYSHGFMIRCRLSKNSEFYIGTMSNELDAASTYDFWNVRFDINNTYANFPNIVNKIFQLALPNHKTIPPISSIINETENNVSEQNS